MMAVAIEVQGSGSGLTISAVENASVYISQGRVWRESRL